MKFTQTDFTKSIVSVGAFPDHYVNKAYTVSSAGVTANSDGKKIVKAGTILPANDATAQGILFYDVDVTHGDASAALLIHGFVDVQKLTEIADAPTAEAIAALKQITFINESVGG